VKGKRRGARHDGLHVGSVGGSGSNMEAIFAGMPAVIRVHRHSVTAARLTENSKIQRLYMAHEYSFAISDRLGKQDRYADRTRYGKK